MRRSITRVLLGVGCLFLPLYAAEVQLIHSIEGPALYQSYCATCHGKDARGNGLFTKVLKKVPPDLARIAVRNHGVFPMEKVQRIISGESERPEHGTKEKYLESIQGRGP